MIDHLLLRRLAYALLFAGLAGLIIFVRMLPLHDGTGGYPSPDLILCMAFAWVLRRSDYAPVLLVAAIVLIADMLFLRAPGVWAALTVLGFEALRRRAGALAEQPFVVEWATVGAVMAVMILAERVLLGLFMVQQVSFGLSVLSLVITLAFYPLVVVISALGLGVRRREPGELAAEGRAA